MTDHTSPNVSASQRVALVLVAKWPTPGRVKTRLAASLSTPAATAVYRLLLQYARNTCEKAAAELMCLDLILLFDPPEMAGVWNSWIPWRRIPQGPGDLGARLEALRQLLAKESGLGCIFIGADAPDLTTNHLAWAVGEIRLSRYAMIPACDGGYVLFGIPAGQVSLFQGIAWGTSRVAQQTRCAALRHNTVISELPALHDIDTYDDLIFLIQRLTAITNIGPPDALRRKLAELAMQKGLRKHNEL